MLPRALFLAVFLLGLIYFLIKRRRFDFFSLAYFSACVYFLPGLFGFASYPDAAGNARTSVEFIPETYFVMATILAMALTSAVVFDRFRPDKSLLVTPGDNRAASVAWIAAVTSWLALAMSVVTSGPSLWTDDKVFVLLHLGRWHILWQNAALIGTVVAFAASRWVPFTACMVALVADLLLGFRVGFAIAIIAMFSLWLFERGPSRLLIDRWKVVLIAIPIVYFFFIIKFSYLHIRLLDYSGFLRFTSEHPGWYIKDIVQWSEPFIIQAILNAVLQHSFHIGLSHFSDLGALFVPLATHFGIHVHSFYDYFQPALFPGVGRRGAMANNIWAEMISSGGWGLLIGFGLFFYTMIGIGSIALRNSSPAIRACIAVAFSYWAFYIHRNDLLYQLILERRVIAVWLAAFVIAVCLERYWRRVHSATNKCDG